MGGANNATLEFVNDSIINPYQFNVAGYGSGGGIALGSNQLSYTATYAGSNPSDQTVPMSNVGISSFSYTNLFIYGDTGVSWLVVAPSGGTVAQGTSLSMTNVVDITGISAGFHSCTVMVSAVDATNSPQSYAVYLSVSKANQTISFPAITDKITTDNVGLAATASSGLGVSFAVQSGSASISGGTNLSFSGSGSVSIVASQSGNSNWNVAPDVTNTFMVNKAQQSSTLVFNPTTPQVYQTTNSLSTTGGSGMGAVSYAVVSGPGQIVGSASLKATAGTGNILVSATKATDAMYLSQTVTSQVSCAKANQTINFTSPGDKITTDVVGLAATASSELTVSFAVGFRTGIDRGRNEPELYDRRQREHCGIAGR